MKFMCQIDRAMNVSLHDRLKMRFKKIENGTFNKFGKAPQKYLNIGIYYKYFRLLKQDSYNKIQVSN